MLERLMLDVVEPPSHWSHRGKRSEVKSQQNDEVKVKYAAARTCYVSLMCAAETETGGAGSIYGPSRILTLSQTHTRTSTIGNID
ncbi:uncharacterized protein BDZ99DRAFT_466233 [Mytilinidion resinicola]|uniref:Uncharacterized protein n=1 Tax=Mytilinidion resinicola TaxID=574789 RepID=A0A6A6YAS8_9PEZI|nr:uncharacterized protein BDZ99DRAFT_466233 [Mytilinidion resinicola]KAF2805926.1 hypothetical protein BDZ99DRAFT_466233 [Mytilinidion resinicola]